MKPVRGMMAPGGISKRILYTISVKFLRFRTRAENRTIVKLSTLMFDNVFKVRKSDVFHSSSSTAVRLAARKFSVSMKTKNKLHRYYVNFPSPTIHYQGKSIDNCPPRRPSDAKCNKKKNKKKAHFCRFFLIGSKIMDRRKTHTRRSKINNNGYSFFLQLIAIQAMLYEIIFIVFDVRIDVNVPVENTSKQSANLFCG